MRLCLTDCTAQYLFTYARASWNTTKLFWLFIPWQTGSYHNQTIIFDGIYPHPLFFEYSLINSYDLLIASTKTLKVRSPVFLSIHLTVCLSISFSLFLSSSPSYFQSPTWKTMKQVNLMVPLGKEKIFVRLSLIASILYTAKLTNRSQTEWGACERGKW